MSGSTETRVLDANVPITANLASRADGIPNERTACVTACVEAIAYVTANRERLVIDAGDEIFSEYRRHLSMSGQPGPGDVFMKWVHDNRWKFPAANRVQITKSDDSFLEFPGHEGLLDFDPSDKKFVAVANAHPEKPPILQATDAKWLRWRDPLSEVGISVKFLCPELLALKKKKTF